MRYRGNKICPDVRTNAANVQPENKMPSVTMSGGNGIMKTNGDQNITVTLTYWLHIQQGFWYDLCKRKNRIRQSWSAVNRMNKADGKLEVRPRSDNNLEIIKQIAVQPTWSPNAYIITITTRLI